MLSFSILLFFNFLGLLAQKGLGVPLPANVLGMLFLAIALFSGVVKLHWVEPGANFLLHHMMLFFVPFVVGALALIPLFRENWLAILASVVLSSLLTMTATGYVAQRLMPKAEVDAALQEEEKS
ncbi:TPA: CidA/LrgA family protein [Candidatus Sumerlaeota bacterium]|jgi:holin-like protein|nr:CidA/LrgA family protein [Candidatus Sumerlaeota bacterium]